MDSIPKWNVKAGDDTTGLIGDYSSSFPLHYSRNSYKVLFNGMCLKHDKVRTFGAQILQALQMCRSAFQYKMGNPEYLSQYLSQFPGTTNEWQTS